MFPKGFLSRIRTFVITDYQADRQGALICRQVSPGAGMDGRWNSFMRFRYENDRVRSGDQTFPRQQFVYVGQMSPSRRFPLFSADGFVGQEVDFENSRPGRGATLNLTATFNPTIHLELAAVDSHQWLHVDDSAGVSQPLFTARVARLRGTYTFTARLFVRLIGQYVSTDRDPTLYLSPVAEHSGAYSGSALFAYKLNWQSVMYVGYGDDRELSELNRLEQTDRLVLREDVLRVPALILTLRGAGLQPCCVRRAGLQPRHAPEKDTWILRFPGFQIPEIPESRCF